MSLDQINNYGPGDNNFTSFQETLDATRRGMAEITLSNYDNDSAPVVKVGSVFENNGAFFQVTTSDITPTGYSGISNSTTFYLYFDESSTAFIYSATAPTWNDARQGWYNSDDRALFSMYKDSGGTLYQLKTAIQKESFPRRPTFGGGVLTDNVYIKRKKIIVPFSSQSFASVATGISSSKIVSISALPDDSAVNFAFATKFSPDGTINIRTYSSTFNALTFTGDVIVVIDYED